MSKSEDRWRWIVPKKRWDEEVARLNIDGRPLDAGNYLGASLGHLYMLHVMAECWDERIARLIDATITDILLAYKELGLGSDAEEAEHDAMAFGGE